MDLIVFSMTLLGMTGCSSPSVSSAVSPASKSAEIQWDGTSKNEDHSRLRMVTGRFGMVVSDDGEASKWGVEILRRGGNAVDAAVATAFALSVSRPHYGSLGGGGFFVYCPAPKDAVKSKCSVIDYREVAPALAQRDMYVKNGKASTELSQVGALASGVPGVVAGLTLAQKQFGKKQLREILSRPIQMAETGIRESSRTEYALEDRWNEMNPEGKKIFGCKRAGSTTLMACPVGTWLKQPDLAAVLKEVSRHGRDGFYKGWVARKISQSLQASGGILSLQDLEAYQPKQREPLVAHYLGYEVVTMPPPSSGGGVVLQMLGFAERAAKQGVLNEGYGTAQTIHALASGMSLAFADRAQHYGDPDFWKVPIDRMISPSYLDQRWASFDPSHYTDSKAGEIKDHEGENTTHFSVVDRDGNAVSITTTINAAMGSAFVPEGTGIVMNNEMDDFSIQPGTPNMFGLIGGEVNAIAPGKRPLSSMTPTIVRAQDGQVRFVLGAQGGPKIISAVFQTLVNRLQFGQSLMDSVAAPRFHHQWRPMQLSVEPTGFSTSLTSELTHKGYLLKETNSVGKLAAIERFPNGRVWGASDPRTEGAAVAE